MAEAHSATAAHELECAICLELLCEPMQLPCSHVFCRRCLATLVQQRRCCALCRAEIPDAFDPTVAPLHQPLEQLLMRQCTVEYMQRVEDVALEAAHLVRLHVGNEYEFLGLCPRPRHRWKIAVGLEAQAQACLPYGAELPDIIKHVRFGLLPACRVLSSGSKTASEAERAQVPPRYVEVDGAPFQVTATSPTSCTVPVVITWQDWIKQPPLRLEHALDFTRGGGFWDYGVDLHAALTGRGDEGAWRPATPPASRGDPPAWGRGSEGLLEGASRSESAPAAQRGGAVGTSAPEPHPQPQPQRARRKGRGVLAAGLATIRARLLRVQVPRRMRL